jgi:hypothetical protein
MELSVEIAAVRVSNRYSGVTGCDTPANMF